MIYKKLEFADFFKIELIKIKPIDSNVPIFDNHKKLNHSTLLHSRIPVCIMYMDLNKKRYCGRIPVGLVPFIKRPQGRIPVGLDHL